MIRLRHALWAVVFGFFGLISWSIYNYFFDLSLPVIVLQGIDNQATYAGDMQCTLSLSKKSEVAIVLDDMLLTEKYIISANDAHQFIIPTKTVSNGPHLLKIDITDTTFSRNKATIERNFFVDNQVLQAFLIGAEDVYKVFQGRTLHIQLQANKAIEKAVVQLFSHEYEFFPESTHSLVYEAFIPIQCEEVPNEYLVNIIVTDKIGNTVTLDHKVQVILFPFKKHSLQISEQKMQEEELLAENNVNFEDIMQKLSDQSPRQKLWKGTFCIPMDMTRITCEFGTVRTTQRKGRYAHKAIDAINVPRSVVWAPQDGIIVLKKRFTYTGNTIVIDHGLGILTMVAHLEDFAKIEVGDKISKGNPLGTMGKTGYASGYHLHWEMRIGNVAIDPMQWTKPTF
ncbi:MAG TPA: M23 family metallopeptidase [Patescibacteria group bacterium]|nr:M23 family metallopeptidase [Patescibacteria group bacterium]